MKKLHRSSSTSKNPGKLVACHAELRACPVEQETGEAHVFLESPQDIRRMEELLMEEQHGGAFGGEMSIMSKIELLTLREKSESNEPAYYAELGRKTLAKDAKNLQVLPQNDAERAFVMDVMMRSEPLHETWNKALDAHEFEGDLSKDMLPYVPSGYGDPENERLAHESAERIRLLAEGPAKDMSLMARVADYHTRRARDLEETTNQYYALALTSMSDEELMHVSEHDEAIEGATFSRARRIREEFERDLTSAYALDQEARRFNAYVSLENEAQKLKAITGELDDRTLQEGFDRSYLTYTGTVPAGSVLSALRGDQLSGLFVAMFVVLTSSTIVSTSMPVIIADLKGSQTQYTWIITAALLTMAVSTPVWAKLGDFISRKILLQIALGIFVVASVAAGFSGNAETLMVWRALSGLSMGGLMATSQVIMADIVSPRERGKYMGILGAIMLVSQLGSPILGGWLTDAFSWHWNFWVMAPFSLVAFIVLQMNLHLPVRKLQGKLDWVGTLLVSIGAAGLLIWISLGGKDADSGGFAWDSGISILLGVGSIVFLLGTVFWFLFGAKEPLIPLNFFKDRTFALTVIASLPIGVAQFGAAVVLAQYMQLARGYSPTESGLMTFPIVIGSLVASVGVGQLVSRTGKWKPFVIGGAVIFVGGAFLLSTIHYNSSAVLVGVYMFLMGLGMGTCMQNLVLVAQNSLPASKMSSGTGTLTFIRTLAGAAGVTVLGSLLAGALPGAIKEGFTKLTGSTKESMGAFLAENPDCAESLRAMGSGSLPSVRELCAPVAHVVESAYGDHIAGLFLPMALIGVIAVLATFFIPNKPLSKKNAVEQIEEELGAEEWALRAPEDGGAPDTSSIPVVRRAPQREARKAASGEAS